MHTCARGSTTAFTEVLLGRADSRELRERKSMRYSNHLMLQKAHPDESRYQFRQQENKQCLSEVSNNASVGEQLMFGL